MQYTDLHDLIARTCTRRYFLSLPVSLQLALHRHNADIHTAAELHLRADMLRKGKVSE